MTIVAHPGSGLGHGFSIDELRARIEEKHLAITTSPAPLGKVPLHIACNASACANGLHCLDYRRTGRRGTAAGHASAGQCSACLEAVAALPRQPAATAHDVVELIDQQRRELIREHYWTAPMDQWAYNQAYRRGRIRLHERARLVLATKIGPAAPYHDGRQTPWNQDVIAYAQHAVAACCRSCVEYWHAIPTGRALEPHELAYLTTLVTLYLDLRFPNLPDDPSKPRSIRTVDLPPAGDPFDVRAGIAALLAHGESPAGMLVPRKHFATLKTKVVVGDSGGELQLRPITQQLRIDHKQTVGTG